MWAIRWSAAIRILRSSSQKTVSEGLWPGRWIACRVRSRKGSSWPSASGWVTATCEPQPRKLRETLRSATVTSSGMPLRSIRSTAKRSSASASSSKLASRSVAAPSAATSAPERCDDDLGQAEVVDVLVGDDQQLEVVDRVAALGQLRLQLVERLARVGPGVDQGQRLVLEQVAVDPPDREGGGDAQAVDSRPAPPAPAPARGSRRHARISPSTSSRLASMSSRETSDSRLSRSSGSVLEGRTLKCHSG